MAVKTKAEPVEELTTNIVLSKPQYEVFNASTRLVLDLAGQGSGKTKNIGISSGYLICEFPRLKGFIAANTHLQLSQSTLVRCFADWEEYYGLTEYDAKENPTGDYVVDKQPPATFTKFSRLKDYRGSISFRNGALVFIGSLENYKARDGKEFAWAHLDETKDTRKEALTTVILGRLRQVGLWHDGDSWVFDEDLDADTAAVLGWKACNPCYIHTSPAEGSVDWLLEMFKLIPYEKEIKATITDPTKYWKKVDEETTVIIYSTYWNEHNLPPGYIQGRLAIYSEEEALKFVWGYPFAKTGGEFYPSFSLPKHTRLTAIDPNRAMHISYDFNSSPYMTLILAQIQYVVKFWHEKERYKKLEPAPGLKPIEVMQIKICKEYCYTDPQNTTEQVTQGFIDDLKAMAPGHTRSDIFIYGDASGRNSIPGLGALNNYKIIKDKLFNYINNDSMRVPLANAAVSKRRDLMNRILEDKIPAVELIIDERCTNTIKDFNFVKRDVDGGKFKQKEKDEITGKKFESVGHTSDAVEYFVCTILEQYLKNIH